MLALYWPFVVTVPEGGAGSTVTSDGLPFGAYATDTYIPLDNPDHVHVAVPVFELTLDVVMVMVPSGLGLLIVAAMAGVDNPSAKAPTAPNAPMDRNIEEAFIPIVLSWGGKLPPW